MKNYFSQSAPFNPYFWSYYHDISELEDFCTTTNAAESVNKKLKKQCGAGYLSQDQIINFTHRLGTVNTCENLIETPDIYSDSDSE